MRSLVLKAYWKLIVFDSYLTRGDFCGLYQRVRTHRLQRVQALNDTIARICSAVDRASIWYWKPVLCLHRSAVIACLLKSYGVRAEMIIGAQHLPFKAHAWVEVDGRVVNDKPYTPELYQVLDRC
jgi:Transglutaminase-like superfamily